MISAYRQNESRREREKLARELIEKQLKPIDNQAASNARMLREISAEEAAIAYRQTRKRLVLEPSPDFLETAPRYVQDGASADEITARCRLAHERFLADNNISKADHQLLWLFFKMNPDADIAQVATWEQAWAYICNVLAPAVAAGAEPEYEAPQPEPVEDSKPLNRDEQDIKDRRDATEEWTREILPYCEEAVDSLEASSGLVMRREQRLELAAHFNKRCANSRRPIPPTVSEWRKTAFQLWGESIGLTAEERDSWMLPEEAALSSAEYAKRVGRINGYNSRPIVLATNVRDL
jgi:hypothetical protein